MSYTPLGDKTVQQWIYTLSANSPFANLSQNQQLLYINNGQQECAMLSKENNLEFYKAYAMNHDIIAAGGSDSIYKSLTEKGASWSVIGSRSASNPNYSINTPIITVGTNLFCTTYGNGVYRSTDGGITWVQVVNGLPQYGMFAWCLASHDSTVYVGTEDNIYSSTDSGATWVAISHWSNNLQKVCHSLLVNGTSIYAGTYDGMYVTTDGGVNWTKINTGLVAIPDIRSIIIHNGILFCADFANGIYSSSNGTTWTARNVGITDTRMSSLYASGNQMFAGGAGKSLYISTDNGLNWTVIIAYTSVSSYIFGLIVVDKYLFVADASNIRRYIYGITGYTYVDTPVTADMRSFTMLITG